MADGSATATEQALVDVEPKKSKRQGKEAHDTDLEWYIVCGASAMGARGTLGGVIAVLEHGGQFSGVPNSDLYTDQQVGWHTTTVGLVEKHRWLSAAWFTIPRETQVELFACYQHPPAAFRSDEGFGARDACPSVEDINRNGAIEPQRPTAFHSRRGTESQLGRFAALALLVCEDPAALLMACQDSNRGKNSRIINRALKAARERAIAAHEVWAVAKEMARGPRTVRERVALAPEYEVSEATP